MTEPDRPEDRGDEDGSASRPRLGARAPLARGAVVASLLGVVAGFTFVPQLLGLALAGLSLARREREGRAAAWLAIAISLVLTALWAVVLGLLLRWWAASRA
ncbi:MAG: hypothetical protein ABIS35_15915 [Terracoccus sp.]